MASRMVTMLKITQHEDTALQNAIEAAALAFHQGWSIEDAAEFTGANLQAAKRYLNGGRSLPYMPTPEQITADCRRFREVSPRRMVGPQVSAVAVPSYSVTADAVFVPAQVT